MKFTVDLLCKRHICFIVTYTTSTFIYLHNAINFQQKRISRPVCLDRFVTAVTLYKLCV